MKITLAFVMCLVAFATMQSAYAGIQGGPDGQTLGEKKEAQRGPDPRVIEDAERSYQQYLAQKAKEKRELQAWEEYKRDLRKRVEAAANNRIEKNHRLSSIPRNSPEYQEA